MTDVENDWPGGEPGFDYSGPRATLKMIPGETSTSYRWEFYVPTGGWTTQHVKTVTSANGTSWIAVYVDLVAPGKDELVTQAFTTIQGETIHQESFDRYGLFVRTYPRDIGPGNEKFREAASISSTSQD